VIDRYGGHPIKIGGDALTILFEPDTEPFAELVLSTVSCAQALRQAGRRAGEVRLPDGSTTQLAHKIGVGTGHILFGVIGDPTLGRECVFLGEALTRASNAEHRAAAGEVWVSSEVVQFIPPGCGIQLKASSENSHARMLLESPLLAEARRGRRHTPSPPDVLPPWIDPLALTPEVVQDHAARDALRFLSSHQIVTVMFVGFSGLDVSEPEDLPLLDRHYCLVQRLVAEHEGTLSEFEAGDKGTKLIVLFGAPKALENPALQAALCARALQQAAKKEGIADDQRIGVATGRLYVGLIGCRSLAKFSALGDRMNLAARLMGLAPRWGVVAESSTVSRSKHRIAWGASSTVAVKGKQERVSISPLKVTEGSETLVERRGTGLVGREQALDYLERTLDKLHRGEGCLLILESGPGLGKTRLLGAVKPKAEQGGIELVATLSLFRRPGSPLAPLLPLLYNILAIPPDSPAGMLRQAYLRWREGLPSHLLSAAQRIAPLLDLNAEDDPTIAGIDPDIERKVRQRALIDCLGHGLKGTAKLLIIDNGQFLDSASIAALIELGPLLKRWSLMVLIARRPADPDPFQPLMEVSVAKRLVLADLPVPLARQLVLNRLGAKFLESNLEHFLLQRAGGNPLRLEAWADVLRQRGIVGVRAEVAYLKDAKHIDELPAQLEGLVLSRLELLPSAVHFTLRVASVLGMSFSVQAVALVHPEDLTKEQVYAQINLARNAGLVQWQRGKPGTAYFSHMEVQNALYTSLPFKVRRSIHQRCATDLLAEDSRPPSGDRALELARHFEHLDDPVQQHRLFAAAAAACEASYDRDEAVHWARRDLKVCEQIQDYAGAHQAYATLQHHLIRVGNLRQAMELVWQWSEAAQAHGTPVQALETQRIHARLLQMVGDPSRALTVLETAMDQARPLDNTHPMVALLHTAVTVLGEMGRMEEALEMAEEAVTLSGPDDPLEWLQTQIQRAYCLGELGRRDEALRENETILANLSGADLGTRALVMGNIGIQLWAQEQPERGHALLLEALALKRQVADRPEEALSLSNVGFSFFRLGDFKAAHRHTEESLRTFRRLALVRGQLLASGNLGATLHLMGKRQEAERALAFCDSLLGIFKHKPQLAETRIRQGELALTRGEVGRAESMFCDALEVAREIGAKGFELSALEGLAETARQVDDLTHAVQYLDQALELYESGAELDFPVRLWYRAALIAEAVGEVENHTHRLNRAMILLKKELKRLKNPETRARVKEVFPWNRAVGALSPGGRESQ